MLTSAAAAHDDRPRVSPRFRTWVADLRASLEAIRRAVDAEEQAAATDERTRGAREGAALAAACPTLAALLEHARRALADLVGDLDEAEHATHRAFCRLHLAALWRHAPIVRRAVDKPLGYAGDYELMNMLYRDRADGESLFGRALNACFFADGAAQATRNRIAYLGGLIRRTLDERPGRPVRIASVGCGPAREIDALLTASPELAPRLAITLVDREERAIAYCERTLAARADAAGARLHLVRGQVRSLVAGAASAVGLDGCDLIYSAGLFDYLEARMFGRIASTLLAGLADDGLVVIGNFAAHNPSRWIMEYFLDWFLVHRTREELLALAADVTPRPGSAWVEAEPSGINLFLSMRR